MVSISNRRDDDDNDDRRDVRKWKRGDVESHMADGINWFLSLRTSTMAEVHCWT